MPARFVLARSLALALVLAAGARGAVARDLLLCDPDAPPAGSVLGTIYGVDLASAADAMLEVVDSTQAGADLEYPWEVAVSPVDDAIYVVDYGLTRTPRIVALCPGPRRIVTQDPMLVVPVNAEVTPSGMLLVADLDTDPAALGPDSAGGAGHGAILRVDPATGAVTVVSDGTSHDAMAGVVDSAFEDPFGVTYDPVAGIIYVADLTANPLGLGGVLGAIYSVRPSDGHVSLVATSLDMYLPASVAVRPDGRPVALDVSGPYTGMAWSIDLSDPDPTTRASPLCGGAQMSSPSDVAISADGTIYVVDTGDFDPTSGTYVQPPALWRVDETNPDPLSNAVLVHGSTDMVTPVSVAARPGCTPGAPATEQLGVNRSAGRSVADIRAACDAACRQPPFALCPEQVVQQPLDGLALTGEGAARGVDSVWLYQHSDAIDTMRVRRAGADLVFASR